MTFEPLTDLEHIELAKQIAAAKRGEAPIPDISLLRRAVESIRVKRIAFVPDAKGEKKASGAKAKSANISFADLGF